MRAGPLMTPEQADALYGKGLISQEQFATFATPAATIVPTENAGPPAYITNPAPYVDAGAPPAPPPAAAGLESALGAQGMSLAAPPKKTSTDDEFAAERILAKAPTPAEPGPEGTVDVGPIRVLNPQGPTAPTSPQYAGVVGARGATFYDPNTGTAMPSAPETPKDFRTIASEVRNEQIDKREQAALQAGAAREALAREQAALYDAQTKEMAKLDAENAVARAKSNAETQAQIEDVKSKVADLGASKVDPGRYWSNASTGTKITAALGLAFGGFAEGFSNGAIKNPALGMINKYIDDDIRAQEANIATKGRAVEASRGVLHDTMAMTQSREAAVSAAKLASLQKAEVQAKGLIAKFDPEFAKASTQDVLAGFETAKANENENLAGLLKRDADLKRAQLAHAAAAMKAAAEKRDATDFAKGAKLKELQNESRKLDIEERKAITEAGKGSVETRSANTEDAAYRAEQALAMDAWKSAVATLPSSKVSALAGSALNTDESSQYGSAIATLGSALTTPGERSDADYMNKVKPKLPAPNDDEATLAKKFAGLQRAIALKHPQAAERAMSAKPVVPTTAPPGRK